MKVLWLARLEYRFHAWREKRARARGRTATVAAFPGYGSTQWVRVLGRVLIPPKARPDSPNRRRTTDWVARRPHPPAAGGRLSRVEVVLDPTR